MNDAQLILGFIEYLQGVQPPMAYVDIIGAIKKFCRGRIEHDEDIMSIECDAEIREEEWDILAYKFFKIIQYENALEKDCFNTDSNQKVLQDD